MARLSFDGFASPHQRLSDIDWDLIIADEASMIPLADIAYAIRRFSPRPIIVAGDPMQIPPIYRRPEWESENIYTMVRLESFRRPQTEPRAFAVENLAKQYRSVPQIGELFSRFAYEGCLEHSRPAGTEALRMGSLSLGALTFVLFPVERSESIFRPSPVNGSQVHIYTALLAAEMCLRIAQERGHESAQPFRIGVVCPYMAQANIVESLVEQRTELPPNVSITVGTVHRFQGAQCNLVVALFNPPRKPNASPIFSQKHIFNVAISRAQDHLCILLPDPERNASNSYPPHLASLIGKALEIDPQTTFVRSSAVEQAIFGQEDYIERNTFVTTHKHANVYTEATKPFEVRIDDTSVDIQLGPRG